MKAKRITIEILSNMRARLRDVDAPTISIIDQALAMPVPGAQYQQAVRSGRWDGKKHLFYVPSSSFPKGLVSRVCSLLTELKLAYKIVDQRTAVPPPKMERLTADMLHGISFDAHNPGGIDYGYQLEAARAALSAGSGILWLATNAGKTEVACAIIGVLKECRTLFLVHKKALLSQTRERIAKRFATIEENVGIIGDGRFDPMHVTVATIQSLTRKTGSKAKRDIIAKYLKTIELLIIDEGHHTKATTWYRLINRIPAPYRYILSGTPFGSENGLMVEAAVGPVVARISNDALIELGVSAKPTITMVPVDEPKLDVDLPWDQVYKEGIVTNTARNTLIVRYTAQLVKAGNPTLILVKELWHGDLISTALTAKKIKHSFVHGRMPMSMVTTEKVRFEDGEISVLIASPIFDEGVDVPAIRGLVIADGGKSIRAVLQKVGRGLRKKVGFNELRIIDFADFTHRWLSQHSYERLAIYEDEGFTVED